MQKIFPVAIAIIHKENKYLLTERIGNDPDDPPGGRVWHFPGGGIEFGETIEVALKREIKEELNLEIVIERQLGEIYSSIRPSWHGILIPYICTIHGEENIILDHESYQFGWFTYKEIRTLKKLPFVPDMVEVACRSEVLRLGGRRTVPGEGVGPS